MSFMHYQRLLVVQLQIILKESISPLFHLKVSFSPCQILYFFLHFKFYLTVHKETWRTPFFMIVFLLWLSHSVPRPQFVPVFNCCYFLLCRFLNIFTVSYLTDPILYTLHPKLNLLFQLMPYISKKSEKIVLVTLFQWPAMQILKL